MTDESDASAVEAERQRTRTSERVEVTTETVEETDYYCPLCEQWYDEESMVIVGIGPTKANEDSVVHSAGYTKHDQLCAHCAEELWDYGGYTGIPGEVSYELDHWTWREMLSAGAAVAIALSPVAFVALVVGVFATIDFAVPAQDATGVAILFRELGGMMPIVVGPALLIVFLHILHRIRAPKP